MSAFVSIVHKDSIELLTDAAIYTPDGTLTGIRSKVFTSMHLPMAITGRGTTLALEAMARGILQIGAALGSFDALVANLEELLFDQWRDAKAGLPEHDIEMLIAGFSEESGPQQWFFVTHDRQPGIEPFRLVEAPRNCVAGPPVSAADVPALSGTIGPGFLAKHGADLLEVMRRKRVSDLVFGTDCYAIGGRAELTTITKAGATTRTMRTWPDKVGSPINPFAAGNVVPIPSGMTRQQRRAAERERRKRA